MSPHKENSNYLPKNLSKYILNLEYVCFNPIRFGTEKPVISDAVNNNTLIVSKTLTTD